jgi:Protein of unknown function (DUF559)
MEHVFALEHEMDAQSRTRERAIAELAARQHGVIAHRQLTALRLGRGAIRNRLLTGRLHPIHRGVYAVGHSRVTGRGRWMAAVLACGPRAVLSYRSAAALWGIAPAAGSRVEVTVRGSGRRARTGIAVHHVRAIDPRDCAVRDGIPLTTISRTLLDLAEVVDMRGLERAFEQAERSQLLDLVAIERLCDRSPGRHGLKPLRSLLAAHRESVAEIRSELERQFLELCQDARLPPPAVNVVVAGIEVDALWRDRRLIVELDGFAYHRSRAAFERDRARDRHLQLAGYRVLRLTHHMLTKDAAAVASAVRSLLGDRHPPATFSVARIPSAR